MSDRTRRTLGAVLIGAGIVAVIAVGGWWAWNQTQGAQLRAQLALTPAPTLEISPSATPVSPETPALTETQAPPPPTREMPASATETPLSAPTAVVTLTVVLSQPAAAEATSAVASPTLAVLLEPTVEPTSTPEPISEAAPVRIMIPDLKIDAPVTEMGWRVVNTADGPRSDWVIPKNEAGHHINSAMLGEPGNLVISGHNNIFGQVFRAVSFAWDDDARSRVDDFTDQSDVLNGRVIKLFDASGAEFDYVVEAFYRLKDTGVTSQQRVANGRFMDPTDEAQLTLITCWPPTSNTHRLVVIARPMN